jgi:parallel beta-helix repeat protein
VLTPAALSRSSRTVAFSVLLLLALDLLAQSTGVGTAPLVQAANPQGLSVTGQLGGPTQAVAVSGNHAFVGVGQKLVVLDISSPDTPTEVGQSLPLTSDVQGIAVVGNLALVADGAGGLYVVDISNLASPTVLGVEDSYGFAEKVVVSGSYAYVADGPAGLKVVSFADPSHPAEVGSVYSLDYAFDVAVSGNFAYIAAGGAGLLIAGIANPSHPTETSMLGTAGYAYGLSLSGNDAIIANGWGGLSVVDVSNPQAPLTLGSTKTEGWAMRVTVSGSKAYVADDFAGLTIVDLSTPSNPKVISHEQNPWGWQAIDVAIAGSNALVADRHSGVRVMQGSSGQTVVQIGLYNELNPAGDVAVSGSSAFVVGDYADNQPLSVVDVSSPSRPAVTLNDPSLGTFRQAVVVGNLLYLLGYPRTGPTASLEVLNISSPTVPTLLSSAPVYASPEGFAIAGGIAYIATEFDLETVNVTNPYAASSIGSYDFTGGLGRASGASSASAVAVLGTSAFIPYGSTLNVMDVSNPAKPTVETAFKSSLIQKVSAEALVGGYLYLANAGQLVVLDVSSPANPVFVTTLSMPSTPAGLTLEGSFLYAACGPGGLQVIDVSTPSKPVLAESISLPGQANAVAVSSGYTYVASGEDGLFVVDPPSLDGALSAVAPDISPRPAPTTAAQAMTPESEAASTPPTPLALPAGSGKSWTVNTSADSGLGSLRWALTSAHAGDKITFDPNIFPESSPATIRPLSPLPYVSQGSILVDGRGAGVILNGSSSPPGTSGLVIVSNYNVIRGLEVVDFPSAGIGVGDGSYNLIGGNQSGEGNVISGNEAVGVGISDCVAGIATDIGANNCGGVGAAKYNDVVGNLIGTSASGESLAGPQGTGVWVSVGASFNVVGGTSSSDRNVISGNTRGGVTVISGGYNNLIEGNYIGTDVSGSRALGNVDNGISIEGSWENNMTGNLISGNGGFGIVITDPGSSGNVVAGNLIGTDASGTSAIGNGDCGVSVAESFNLVGGATPGARNLISGNGVCGIVIGWVGTTGVVVTGNYLGTDISGTRALGSTQEAIDVGSGSYHNFIGGMTSGEANVVSGQVGVVLEAFDWSNFIIGNSVGSSASGSVVLPNSKGIQLTDTQWNFIQANRVSGSSSSGIFLWTGADSNWVRANNVTMNSGAGISVNGDHNLVTSNDFSSNGVNGYDGGTSNMWNASGSGNYWSDYSGADRGDGIGSTPYVVKPNGWDNFPLTKPNGGLTTTWLTVESNIPDVSFRLNGLSENTGAQGISLQLEYFRSYNITFPRTVQTPGGTTSALESLNGETSDQALIRLYENRTMQVTYGVQSTTTTTTTSTSTSASTSTTTTSATVSTSTSSATHSTPTSSSSTSTLRTSSSSGTGSGAIPEFSDQLLLVVATVLILVASYVIVRRRGSRA